MTDRDRAESIGQGGQVSHAEVEGAGGAVARQVTPEGALAGSADAVVLRGVLGAQRQRPGATHAVVARDEVDIVGQDADRAPAGRRGQHAAAQGQQRFALGEFDVDAAGSGVQAAVGPVVGHDVEVIDLAHDDVALGGHAPRERVDDGEFRHRSVDRALDALRLQAQQRLRRVEGGARHVQHARGVQRQVGGAPARAAAGEDIGGGGVVAHLDAVQRIGEVDGTGTLDELVVIQPDGLVSRAADGRQLQPVSAAAARHLQAAASADEQQVVALACVHEGLARADVDGVIAATAEHGVGARAHVDDLGRAAADKTVVALTALVAYARHRAALEDVVAGPALDDAASRAPKDVEVVLAVATVEVEHGLHALADVDRIAALAAAGHDTVHAVVLDLLAEGLDRDAAIGVGKDGVGLVDGVVVEVTPAVAPGGVARVQVQGVAILARDHGTRAEAPQVAARHGDTHHRDAGGHVGADRGEVDRGAEACEGDVDLEQAEVDLEVQRAIGAARKARLAAEQDAHPGFQTQRPELDVKFGRAADQEIAIGLDEALDVDDQKAEEIQRALEVQTEDLVDDLDAAFKRHLEGQHLQLALDLEVEQGVGGDRVRLAAAVRQRGVGAAACVDLQRGVGENAQLRHAELELRLHSQREEGRGAVDAEGGGAGDLDLTEVAQVQRQVHGSLHASLVDQQVHRAAQLDRAHLDGRLARDAQGLGSDAHLRRLALRVEEGTGHRVAPAHLLRRGGGVDLQQEAAADRENVPAVDDGGTGVVAAHLQRAVDARLVGAARVRVDHQPQRAGHTQGFEKRQVQGGGDAQFQHHARLDLGHDDREVALEVQRAIEQLQAALAREGGVHARPGSVLARREGSDGELPAFVDRRRRRVIGAEVGRRAPEDLGNVVDDELAEGVQTEVELGVELGHRAQVQVRLHVHAQRYPTLVDDEQARSLSSQIEAVGADLDLHVGKGGKAVLVAEAEVELPIQRDQPKQLHLHRAEQTQELRAVVQYDRLARVSGVDRVARPRHTRRVIGVRPGALAEVDRRQTHRNRQVRVVGDRARSLVAHELTHAEREARPGVDLDSQIPRLESGARHADKADLLHRGSAAEVKAKVYARGAETRLLGQHEAEVEILDGQADGACVANGVLLVDTAVVVVVVKVTLAAKGDADEAVGIVDAHRQRGDLGCHAVGQRDALAPLLGQRHRRRQLQEAGEVDLRVTDLGLHDLLVEIDEDHVVAAGRQREARSVNAAVLVAVLARVDHAVAVLVLGVVAEGGAALEVDGRRAEELQCSVDRARGLPEHEGVDVDLNVLGLHFKDVFFHADQRSGTDASLGCDEPRIELPDARHEVQQRGRHDRKAEVDVCHLNADRSLVDEVGDTVRRVGARRAGQVRAVAVRAADAGKTGQVGAAQGERSDLHVVHVPAQRGTDGGADALQQRCQATGVDADVVHLSLAEGQRALQVQEVGDDDLREADVQAHQFAAVEIEPHWRAAGGDDQTLVRAGTDAGVHRHRPQQAVHSLTAGVGLDRDVFCDEIQHVAQAIDAKLVSLGFQ